ncbi:MAG TPA: gliding motility protein GldC [Cytophagaceae bacterium]|jgi:gliding motility-associated protein GldC|nr:gliding motility protein GldC [Cytophagaceae bacterium]
MKTSEINFKIETDNINVPEKIYWKATDGPSNDFQETKAISISIWDHTQFNTMRIGLWAKDMTVYDMKRFCVEMIDGMAEEIQNATGDDYMVKELRNMCSKLAKHVDETSK